MTLSIIFLMAVASVATVLIVLARTVGLAFVLRHATAVDVVFTVMCAIALAGTLTGLCIAIVAGLVMTGTLTVLKALVGRLEALRASRAVFATRKVAPAEDWCPGGSAGSLNA